MRDRALQLTFRGATRPADADFMDDLARDYREHGVVLVRRFLDQPLLHWLQREIASSTSKEHKHTGLESTELTLQQCTGLGLLAFMANDPAVFGFVQQLTGRPALSNFIGRVYSRVPSRHQDQWHDDLHPDRLVGMSINLSTGVYEGGVFEIRETESQRLLGTIANTGFGDAIFFAIDEKYEHRVSPLAGTVVKTAYAGWFGAARDYNATLRRDPTLPDQ